MLNNIQDINFSVINGNDEKVFNVMWTVFYKLSVAKTFTVHIPTKLNPNQYANITGTMNIPILDTDLLQVSLNINKVPFL